MPSRADEIRRALERAQDQTEELEAREAAIEELRNAGVYGDDNAEDALKTALDAMDIERELEALKDELASDEQ